MNWTDKDELALAIGREALRVAETHPLAKRKPKTGDYTLVKTDTLDWLLGERGTFECPKDQYINGKAPPYWWRKHLREAWDEVDTRLHTLLDFVIDGFGASEDHDVIRAAIKEHSPKLTAEQVDAVMARIVKPSSAVAAEPTEHVVTAAQEIFEGWLQDLGLDINGRESKAVITKMLQAASRASAATVGEPSGGTPDTYPARLLHESDTSLAERVDSWHKRHPQAAKRAESTADLTGEYAYHNGRGLYETRYAGMQVGWTLFGDLHKYEQAYWIAKAAQQQAEPGADERAAWFAVVMEAAAALENVSYCTRDEDAKHQVIGAATYARERAKVLLAAQSGQRAGVAEDAARLNWLVINGAELKKLENGDGWTVSTATHAVSGKVNVRLAIDRAMQSRVPLKTKCPICGEKQFSTPSGISCPNGHGGADGYDA